MPTVGEALQYGLGLYQAGRYLEAADVCRQVVAAVPAYAEAWYLLGSVQVALGRNDEAVASLVQAAGLRPEHVETHNNLGIALARLRRTGEAVEHFRRAIALRPGYGKAMLGLAKALLQEGEPAEAGPYFEQVLQQNPNEPDALAGLGLCLSRLGRFEEPIPYFEAALRFRPGDVDTYVDLATAYYNLGRYAEARAHLETALRIAPASADAVAGMGIVLLKEGQSDEALPWLDRALELNPAHARARYSRATLWLQRGDLARGWPEYEARWHLPGVPQRTFAAPRWDGRPLHGQPILLHAEQGFGDAIQFIRFAPLVKARDGYVVVEVVEPLVPLLSRCPGVGAIYSRDRELPAYVAEAPFMSVPGILGTTLETIPNAVPYVFPDPERVERWRDELTADRAFKIGIAWQGRRLGEPDRNIPLSHFLALADVPGVRLYSLQKGDGAEEVARLPDSTRITDLAPRLDVSGGAFMDSAAVMQHLDLIVTSDTALAHLAGAMARTIWVGLPDRCEWRWLKDRSDSPWYPTMRLFRQPEPGAWGPVFGEMAEALRDLLARRASP